MKKQTITELYSALADNRPTKGNFVAEIAKLTKCAPVTVGRWMRGEVVPSLLKQEIIAKHLGMDANDLFAKPKMVEITDKMYNKVADDIENNRSEISIEIPLRFGLTAYFDGYCELQTTKEDDYHNGTGAHIVKVEDINILCEVRDEDGNKYDNDFCEKKLIKILEG